MISRSRRARALGVLALLAVTASACGSSSSSDASSATTAAATTAAATTVVPAATDADSDSTATALATTEAATTTAPPATVPPGTKLRVGDQQNTLKLPLDGSGEATKLQSSVEYSTFAAGPPLVEAFNAGAIDLGYVGDTPPVLAAARGQDIVIVGAWHYNGNLIAVVAPPGKSITSVADLKGKKFAYTKGTALQAFALRALKEAGLTEADVETVDVPILDIVGALKSGDVDAGVVIEPILTPYLKDNPDAKVVRDGKGLTTGLQLLITTKKTLEDPAKSAAIGDFIAREIASTAWRQANPDEFAAKYAEANQIDVAVAKSIIERNGVQPYVPIDEKLIGELQILADVFFEAGAIPSKLDVHSVFDDRFNDIVKAGNS